MPKTQSLKKSIWLHNLIGDKSKTCARDSSEVARTRCFPHTRNGGYIWCSVPLVRLTIQNEVTDVARSVLQRAHYHADVIDLLSLLEVKKANGDYGTPG